MLHLSNIPQAAIDKVAVTLCEVIEEAAANNPLRLIPESHLYLYLQKLAPQVNLDDWQAISMAMRATGRVTLSGHAFRVAQKRTRKGNKAKVAQ
jgi:hypothetical protein